LEEVIAHLNRGVRSICHASGRTDTGVHAVGQVVHFQSEITLPPHRLLRALNGLLPADIAVHSVEEVPLTFDASRSAKRKLYRYVVNDSPVPDIFLRRFAWHFPYCRLNDGAMRQAATCLLGTHDFRCFESHWPNRKSSVRTITHIGISRFGDYLWIDVEANGFLYNMVRSITGTLVNIGRDYWPVERMQEIVEQGDRTQAGPTAPPQGLFLMRVTY
jgi:tRNA pseudouridine38-40 synthase